MKLTSAPRLSASMQESPLYAAMGVGFTDRLFLLAHHGTWNDDIGDLDGPIKLNDPYPVSSMQQAVDDLGADTDSPLLLALMEAYYSGARDIWLVAVAPMYLDNTATPTMEYEPDFTLRGIAYYTQYRDRLNATYEILKYWDIAQITVPVDAPFNSTVDFLGPLVNYCMEGLNLSGDIHLGIMGTRGTIDTAMVNALVSDGRLAYTELGQAGKFVSVFAGDGTYQLKELPFHHTSSLAVGIAAELTQLPLDRGLTYHRLRNVIHTVGPDLPHADINRLAEARINYVGRNIRGRRNNSFEVIPFTDNTLAWDGSDYWSLAQTRLVSVVSAQIRSLGMRRLGTIGYDLFRKDVEDYLINLANDNMIRGYELDIRRDQTDRNKVLVDVELLPYFGVREIYAHIVVGPGQ